MNTNPLDTIPLLTSDELSLRLHRLAQLMSASGVDAMLISSATNLYYLSGRVISGFAYVTVDCHIVYLVKRPLGIIGDSIAYIRKPEDIPSALSQLGYTIPPSTALELDSQSFNTISRLSKALNVSPSLNASAILRQARAVKTTTELALMRTSGVKQAEVYRRIPGMFNPGMTDIDLQIAIENRLRSEGCFGLFRIAGDSMEMYMGSVLAGHNADAPSPYDFAMGGAGIDPSIPVGANGTELRPGMAVMVDMNGNFTGYMTDMTRTFAVGAIDDKARQAHQLSIAIINELSRMGRPGIEAKSLYDRTLEMSKEAGFENYFMGHRQKAGFVGHGVGIEVNEAPVIAPRSRDILAVGQTIALEPKFVIPSVGAVGVEDTFVVTPDGLEPLTILDREIISL